MTIEEIEQEYRKLDELKYSIVSPSLNVSDINEELDALKIDNETKIAYYKKLQALTAISAGLIGAITTMFNLIQRGAQIDSSVVNHLFSVCQIVGGMSATFYTAYSLNCNDAKKYIKGLNKEF